MMKVLDIIIGLFLLVYGFLLMFGGEKYLVDPISLNALYCFVLSGLIAKNLEKGDKEEPDYEDEFFNDDDDLDGYGRI